MSIPFFSCRTDWQCPHIPILPLTLTVVFRHGKIERRQNDGKILKRKILGRQMETVPIHEGRRHDPVAPDPSILADSQPASGSAARGLHPTQRRTPTRADTGVRGRRRRMA